MAQYTFGSTGPPATTSIHGSTPAPAPTTAQSSTTFGSCKRKADVALDCISKKSRFEVSDGLVDHAKKNDTNNGINTNNNKEALHDLVKEHVVFDQRSGLYLHSFSQEQ